MTVDTTIAVYQYNGVKKTHKKNYLQKFTQRWHTNLVFRREFSGKRNGWGLYRKQVKYPSAVSSGRTIIYGYIQAGQP